MVFLISVLHGFVSNFDDKRNVLHDEMYIYMFSKQNIAWLNVLLNVSNSVASKNT